MTHLAKGVHTILALDIATSTGWALRDSLGHVTSGVQSFELGRGESPGMRFLRFRRWLLEVTRDPLPTGLALGGGGIEVRADGRVDVIAYERAHHRGGAATAVCAGFAAVMQEVAADLGIELLPVHTRTLKKHATGMGNASKHDMIAAAMNRWGISDINGPIDDDEADALCVLSWALEECGVTA